MARQADNSGYRAVIEALDLADTHALVQREGGLEPFSEGLYGCSEMFVNGLLALAEAGVIRRPVQAAAGGQGIQVHGGFFLGPSSFYQRLNALSLDERARYDMTAISYINELYGNESQKREQRQHARFINTAIIVTLLGAAVSDQLEDGRVLSGVGGQYNFVVQGHALEGARSVLLVRSWREAGGTVSSNIVWDYGHCTIPRHLRDIVISEYGIADLRGKTDAQVIEALLQISDSRFQDALIGQAQVAGKLPRDFRLAPRYRENTPERQQAIRDQHAHLFPEYPLGADFTEVEKDLLRALNWLKSKYKLSELLDLGKAALDAPEPGRYPDHLQRMDLAQTSGLREDLWQRLLLAGLAATEPPPAPAYLINRGK